jgi:hypothetical protein
LRRFNSAKNEFIDRPDLLATLRLLRQPDDAPLGGSHSLKKERDHCWSRGD